MKSARVVVANRLGLHARPAALFVAVAQEFASQVLVGRPDDLRFADAKRVMSVLALNIGCGEEIEIEAEGADEELAVAALVTLVERDFDAE